MRHALPTKLWRLTLIPAVEHAFEHYFSLEPIVFTTRCFEDRLPWSTIIVVTGQICVPYFKKRQMFWNQTIVDKVNP